MNTGVPQQVDSVFVCRNEFVCISKNRRHPKSASLIVDNGAFSIGFEQIHIHSAVMLIADRSVPGFRSLRAMLFVRRHSSPVTKYLAHNDETSANDVK